MMSVGAGKCATIQPVGDVGTIQAGRQHPHHVVEQFAFFRREYVAEMPMSLFCGLGSDGRRRRLLQISYGDAEVEKGFRKS